MKISRKMLQILFLILSGLHNIFNKVSVIRELQQQIPIYFSQGQGYLFSTENDELRRCISLFFASLSDVEFFRCNSDTTKEK